MSFTVLVSLNLLRNLGKMCPDVVVRKIPLAFRTIGRLCVALHFTLLFIIIIIYYYISIFVSFAVLTVKLPVKLTDCSCTTMLI